MLKFKTCESVSSYFVKYYKVYNAFITSAHQDIDLSGYYKATATVNGKSVAYYFNLLPAITGE